MLFKAIKKFKKLIFAYSAIGIISGLCSTLSVVFFQNILDTISGGSIENLKYSIITPLICYGFFTIAGCVVEYLDNYPDKQLKEGVYYYLKLNAIKKVKTIDYLHYQDFGTGQLVQNVENGAQAGTSIIMFFAEVLTRLLPSMLFSVIAIGAYNSKVMLVIAGGYIVVYITSSILLKKLYALKDKILSDSEWISKYYVRALMELIAFRVNKKYEKEIRRLEDKSREIVNAETSIIMVHEFFFAFFYLIVIIMKILLIVIGVFTPSVSIGAIVAMVLLIDKVYNPISIFNVLYVEYKLNRIAYDRYAKFIYTPNDANVDQGKALIEPPMKIRFDSVSFSYKENTILQSISMQMESGKSYAIVGMSGAGKSTVVKLIVGLIKTKTGSVLIDGMDINEINLDNLYDYVSYVPQEAPVFDGTIKENLIIDRELEEAEIRKALEDAGLREYIEGLENGIYTEIGEKGIKLSGGEKQKLAFARVFIQQPQILILDEATASMDFISESSILCKLQEKLKDSIVIMVAHRLRSISYVDQIFVMDRGRIAEQGTYNELLDHEHGKFREMWLQQGDND